MVKKENIWKFNDEEWKVHITDAKLFEQAKKKKEIPVGGKTKIEVNPDVDIGNFSGGMRVNSGNLH